MIRHPLKRKKQPDPTEASARAVTFGAHLVELRNRVFVVALVFFAAMCAGYTLHEEIIRVLVAPLDGQKLMYLTPGGGFDFVFTVSLYFGLCLTAPVFLFHLYRFLKPLLQPGRGHSSATLLLSSILLAIAGITFGYFVAIPSALQFLTQFGGEYIDASLTASAYLTFIIAYLLGLAALFQLPLLLILANNISGPLKPSKLLASERFVILGAFVAAAIITPTPDVMNQALIAVPIILIYQLGVASVWVQNRRQQARPNAPPRYIRAWSSPSILRPVHAEATPKALRQTPRLAHHPRPIATDIVQAGRYRQPAIAPLAKQQHATHVAKGPRLTITDPRRRLASIDGFLPLPR